MSTNGNNSNANALGNPPGIPLTQTSLGGTSFPSSYDFVKTFVNARSATGSGNNGVTDLDDPTYLGFELMFDITSPLFNGATNGDPGIFEGGSSNEYPATPSAIGYLNKIGEANRVEYLKAFIQGMLEIQRTRPYYFQTIGGLLEAYTKSLEFSKDPFTGSSAAEGVTIGCLEAIDLKITALFNLYRMACYDVRYKRFVLPKNLMRFDIYINVHEIRKFKTTVNGQPIQFYDDGTQITASQDNVNANTSQIRFKFSECIFDVGSSGKVFEGVTNAGGDIATTEMKFGYSVLELISSYAGFDSSLEEDKKQTVASPGMQGKQKSFIKSKLGEVGDKVKAVGDQALTNLKNSPERLKAIAESKASGAIDSFVLGNVFGLTGLQNSLIGTLQNPQGLINAALGALATTSDIGTILDSGSGRLGELTGTQKAFEGALAGGSLESVNVFGPSGPPNNSAINNQNVFD